VFKGIPYGGSTAATRFRPPVPPAGWVGERDALAYPPMAPQPAISLGGLFASWTFDKEMSEDCLALNLWTPAVGDGARRPVMVWLHGGDFASLSGSRNVFDGTRLAQKGDVVVVTLNHRLNSFGFLYLNEIAPGLGTTANAGMLDLVLALQWVRDNIGRFGGDPGNVTIFGQSGGGGKVSTLMAMPQAAGLFHKAIVQSGSYARNAHLEAMKPAEAMRHAASLLAVLEMAPADAGKLLDMPMAALVEATSKAAKAADRPVWRPVADGRVLPGGPFWPEAPAVSAQVPLMIGTTLTEMTMLIGTSDAAAWTLDEDRLKKRLAAMMPEDAVWQAIETFRATRPGATPAQLFFAISTAAAFRRGAWLQAGRKAAQGAAPVWLYEVDWTTPVDGGKWGSPHSVELALVFDNVARSGSMVGTGPQAQVVADAMSNAWLAFARTGTPSTAALPWPAWTSAGNETMVFDAQSRAVAHFRDDERALLLGVSAKGAFD